MPKLAERIKKLFSSRESSEPVDIVLDEYRAYLHRILIPRPSSEQVGAFVDHVSNAHSWYKKLPLITAGVPFSFYIDPWAGSDYAQAGRGRWKAVSREESGFHYSQLPTSDYLLRFGHLQYATPYRMAVYSEGRWWGVASPAFLGDNGKWWRVPSTLLAAGTTDVTGIIHDYSGEAWCLKFDMLYRVEKSPLTWPEDSGGLVALEEIKRLWAEHYDLVKQLPRLPAGDKHDIERYMAELSKLHFGEAEQQFNARLEAIFAPERSRLRTQMRRTITQMLDMVYTA